MSSNDLLGGFLDKKKAESAFLSLEDGESCRVKRLKDIKLVTKAGFGGEEKEVIRLICVVETTEGEREKSFDNGTQRFAKEMQEKGINIGSAFVITRTGLQTKTRYTLSEVSNPTAPAASAAPASAAPTTPQA